MPKNSATIDFIIGGDTHKHSHTASIVDRNGAELHTITLATDAFGAKCLLQFARQHAPMGH
ncbi:hypothetical protein [Aidingimonas halophila]|uniref:Transposase n=1 Tax=Aidingimonas halophila TaxID=574349 RepID=A0A1H2ZRV3_9GAMM|nr:hypothetical protein [Aidingimonas halophila]GHC16493.1 hypothetical protein GCM10008094_02200 [Aidingimonas halophila]SDX19578.1 hypothetical protein SAMN05443545_104223 [Aidingimonas halophila]